jgi:hypothetical protein
VVWRGTAEVTDESPAPSGVVVTYDSASVAEARAVLAHGIERRVPLLTLTGKAGAGTSTVLQSLHERFGGQCDLALPANPPATVTELVVSVLRLLGRPFVDAPASELLGSVRHALETRAQSPRPLALLLDDVELLPDDVLEVLGEFGPQDGGDRALLPIVLAGGPGLLPRLSSRRLASLRRGLTIDVRLHVPTAMAALIPAPRRATVAPPRRTGRPRTLVLAALCGCLCGAAALYLEQVPAGLGSGSAIRDGFLANRGSPAALAAVVTPPPVGPWERPPPSTEQAGDAALDDARRTIIDFQRAMAAGDGETLRSLLAQDVRYNGVVGVDAALDDQIWLARGGDRPRFLPPDTVRIEEGSVRVEGRFYVPFRDVAGMRDEVAGRAVWHVARRADLLQIVDVEYDVIPSASAPGPGG